MAINLNYSATMLPNAHEKREWSRMAQSAYRNCFNDIGHRYSVAASLPHDGTMRTDQFDMLQAGYRQWLTFGVFPNGKRAFEAA